MPTKQAAADSDVAHSQAPRVLVVATASEVRKNFRHILSQMVTSADIVVTRRGVPCAVVLSVERYRDLAGGKASLSGE